MTVMECVKVMHVRTTLLIAVSVCIWWAANSITAGSSKSLMRGDSKPDKNSWSDAFLDFRWFELTALQHLIGAIVSIIWLKIIMRESVWPADASKRMILYASLSNVVGNMATNAAYAMVSSSMTQVVKTCEPLFMFGLSLILYRDYKVLNFTTLSGIVIMVIGAILFVAFDSTFIISGLLAALCSNVAFPIRNIYLKKVSSVWKSSFQKYAVISSYSVLVLAPFMLAKVLLFQSFALIKKWQEGLISSLFHCTYNLASIYVLQNFTPLTHAILKLLKRGIVIVVNLVYFQLPLSWKMVIGLIAVLAGLFIYLYRNHKGEKFSPPSVVLVLIAVVLVLVLFVPSDSVKGLTVSQGFPLRNTIAPADSMIKIASLSSVDAHNKIAPHLTNTFVDASQIGNKIAYQLPGVQSSHHKFVMAQPSAVSLCSAWVYDRPVSKEILSNIQSLAALGPVMFYCGTSHCMQALNDLSNRNITATFLILPQLVENSPFEEWLANHPLYKVVAFDSFENHLQEVVRLSVLWKYGGLYIEPNIQLKPQQSLPSCSSDPWVGKQTTTDSVQHFDIACFPEQNKFIEKLSDMFAKEYFKSYKSKPTMQLDEGTWKSDFSSLDLPQVIQVDHQTLSLEIDQPWNHHYGTLSYDSRDRYIGRGNLGDELQSYPGLQFLPFLDNFLERDTLTDNKNNDQHITAFFNAWWGSGVAKWPPQSNIDPLLMSLHVSGGMTHMWKEHVDYLLPRAPVGCRDFGTCNMFQKSKVPAYFSGCMTLTLQVKLKRTDEIFIVDLKNEYFQMIPSTIQKKAARFGHGTYIQNSLSHFTETYKIIKKYSRAKLVITQRIHCALPCVAMGTPVIFINSAGMPGGGGSNKGSSGRTVGLTSMFHTLNTINIPKENTSKWLADFPYDDPPPNPDLATLMRLRATFWYQIRKRPTLFDAGCKFGVVPMPPPSPCVDSVLFHTIFPHPDEHFTWQDHRSIESIFRYYPCASIVVHSNTLDDTRFDVFRESGYTIQTMTYDMESLYKDTSLILRTQSDLNDQGYLIRALLLYKWGGVYMDSNIILTKSLDDLPRNFVVWADPFKEEVDASFMRFEKESKFLELVISKLAADPDHQRDSIYTQSVKEFKGDVSTLDSRTVFVFDNNQVGKQCYEVTSGSEYNSWKNIANSAVAVALSSVYSLIKTVRTTPLKADTLCKMLLNDHCVICSEIL